MENESRAVAIGLGAGLGRFVDFVIVVCILWHCFCRSWSEKKKVQPTTTLVPIRDQRKRKTINESEYKSHVTTNTSINITNASSDSQSR